MNTVLVVFYCSFFFSGYQIEVRFSAEDRFDDMMILLRGICEVGVEENLQSEKGL